MTGEIDWAPVVQSLAATNWTAVFVALVTGFTAIVGPVWVWYSQVRRERKSVRAALFVEVAILVELIELRGYLEGLRETEREIASLTDAQREEFEGYEYSVNVHGPYNNVFQANVSKLGSLSVHEASQIVRFYQMADSVVADLTPGGVLYRGTDKAEDFRDVADLLEEVLKIGHELTSPKSRFDWLPWMRRKK
ncbi:hypothetical protein ACXX9E_07155 [Pseudomonas sp. GNP014]